MVDGRPRGIEVPWKDTLPGAMVAFRAWRFAWRVSEKNSHPRKWPEEGMATPRYSTPSMFCTTSKRYSPDCRCFFGAGAVKGRVTRGAERIGGNSAQHLGRHQVASCIKVDPTSLSLLTSKSRATGGHDGGAERRYGEV